MTVRSALLIAAAAAVAAAGQLAAVEPPPAVTSLLAARADRSAGAPDRAFERLSAAVPAAGELAAALRIDAAGIAVTLGRDPWPLLAPLLARHAPAAHRPAATAAVRAAAAELPLPLAAGLLHRPLPRPLRREVRALLAIRACTTRHLRSG